MTTPFSLPKDAVATRPLLAMSDDDTAPSTIAALMESVGVERNHMDVTLGELYKRGAVKRVRPGCYVRLVGVVESVGTVAT